MASAGSLMRLQRLARLGRKLVEVKDPNVVPALERMLSDEVAGDPMGRQKWVRSSIRDLSKKLKEQGHQVGKGTVARLLRKMGYSLQVNKKKQAGSQHPDRDEQFRYIAALKAQFLREGLPVVSIDTKKKELIGNYRREGTTWRRRPIEDRLLLRGICQVRGGSFWNLRCRSKRRVRHRWNIRKHGRVRGQLFGELVEIVTAARRMHTPTGC